MTDFKLNNIIFAVLAIAFLALIHWVPMVGLGLLLFEAIVYTIYLASVADAYTHEDNYKEEYYDSNR